MAIFVNNITIHTGTDFEQTFNIENANDLNPLDLTNYNGCAEMKTNELSLTKTSFSVNFTNRLLGQVKISLASSITENLKPGNYVYDFFLKNSTDNSIIKVSEGKVFVKKSVTRI
jgi:hypothetical protein